MPRKDKLQDVPMVITQSVYERLLRYQGENRLSSEQSAARNLVITAANLLTVARELSVYFRKGLTLVNHDFPGRQKVLPYRLRLGNVNNGIRVHCRLSYNEWVTVSDYSNAIGCPLSHAASLLVILGLENYFGEIRQNVLQA